MGQIQSGINSALGSMGLLKGLYDNSPEGKAKFEKNKLNQQYSVLREKIGAVISSGDKGEEAQKYMQGLRGELEDIAKRRFELDPTPSHFNTYSEVMKLNRLSAQQARQRAQQHMQNSQDEKRMKIYGANGEVINGQ